jgi:alpha-ribazole phosphatase/probable phosphoglycerate mutase
MTGLLFIRHAETDMAGRFCGHSDPPINARGKQQIQALVESVEPMSIEAVYCSDLRRSAITAEALAEASDLSVVARRNLREIHFGDWEGMNWTEVERRDATYAREWVKAFPKLPAPGGERFADFEVRVMTEVDTLVRHANDQRVAVVTHGGVMRVVLQKLFACTEHEAWDRTRSYCCSFAYERKMVHSWKLAR